MKTRLSIAIAGVVAAAAFATPASAATIIGQTPAVVADKYDCAPIEGAMVTSGPGAPSYTVPDDGVITSFRHLASGAVEGDHSIRLKTWRHGVDVHQFVLAGASDPVLLTPGVLNEFDTRVPVAAGDMLGLTTLTYSKGCAFDGVPGDLQHYDGPRFDTSLGESTYLTVPMEGFRWNIEATVEPDADGDGFGDETQDECSEQSEFQGPCPPETTILSASKFVRSDGTRFRFRSSIAGSRFTCRMDNRRPRPCTSPIVYRGLEPRKHVFRVRAAIRGKVADPTPAKKRLGVKRTTNR